MFKAKVRRSVMELVKKDGIDERVCCWKVLNYGKVIFDHDWP